ncbi:MAG TPA: class I SAM-dependent methyltransferase [Calditrichaeota bacterium]|nr:class I SAM-dependent methyltransferase [Calditrichota bacterium]
MSKIYPDSHVEIQGLMARHYDTIMDLISAGIYAKFIKAAVAAMDIQSGEFILDLGCGTGRNACLMRPYLGDTGYILGLDISQEMGEQFRRNCRQYDNVDFRRQRIDIPFELDKEFDTVFMSFVLHGLPHEVRLTVLDNIYKNLRPGGRFCLLDFSEFKLKEMPALYRWLFTTFECKYAWDFVERDWQSIFKEKGLKKSAERFWFKNYVRLFVLEKNG